MIRHLDSWFSICILAGINRKSIHPHQGVLSVRRSICHEDWIHPRDHSPDRARYLSEVPYFFQYISDVGYYFFKPLSARRTNGAFSSRTEPGHFRFYSYQYKNDHHKKPIISGIWVDGFWIRPRNRSFNQPFRSPRVDTRKCHPRNGQNRVRGVCHIKSNSRCIKTPKAR